MSSSLADAPVVRNPAATEFVLTPNRSIAPCALLAVFAGLALVTTLIAICFGILSGAWMILPFAGVETAALAVAFAICLRRSGDYERVRVAPGTVLVERAEGGVTQRREFNPAWARLCVVRGPRAIQVFLSQFGRQVELGRFLGLERRFAFAREFEAAFRAAARA